ncbi:MAG: YceI family protein [Pyrinomonadaceae bacterium]
MMKALYLAIFSATVLLSGCADPGANKPRARTGEPSASNTPSAATELPPGFAPLGTELGFDPVNSKIEFTGSKVTGKHDGGFNSFRGAIDLVDNKPETSRVVFTIDMASVYTDDDSLTKHLKTGDFFQVDKFPTSTFVSTKIVPQTGLEAGNYSVTGELAMRGVKKTITFPAKVSVGTDAVLVNSEFTINRKDFGITYRGLADDLIREDVVVKLTINATRNK